LSRIALGRLTLSAVNENLRRIAFLRVPENRFLIAFINDGSSRVFWSGTLIQENDLIILGPGCCVYVRTEGPCCCGSIWFPAVDLAHDGNALTNPQITVPAELSVRRPPSSDICQLRHLYSAAMKSALERSDALPDPETKSVLEQQLMHGVVACMGARRVNSDDPARRRREGLAVSFEKLLSTRSNPPPSVAEIGAALGVSGQFLRRCCGYQLGMSPSQYLRFRRLQMVHRVPRQRRGQIAQDVPNSENTAPAS
jgi:AraC-like DNA-binding protein